MYLAKVTGALVSTTKHASLNGSKLLIVARLDDTVGAGNGEIVINTTGSSARMSNNKDHSVIDAAVVGIVDSLELNG